MPLHLPQVPTQVLQRCWTSLKKSVAAFIQFSADFTPCFSNFFFATFPLFLIKQCCPVYTSSAYVQVFICMHRWAIICRYSSLHLHRILAYSQLVPSIGIKTFWECRCEEVVPHPSSGFTYLLFKAVLCCVIVQTHSHFVKCVKRQRARSKHNTWVVHPPVPFLCFCTYHTDVLWFWAALCLPTYSKETLHFLSSDDGNGIRLDPFIQQEREERKKCRSGMSHAHAAAL